MVAIHWFFTGKNPESFIHTERIITMRIRLLKLVSLVLALLLTMSVFIPGTVRAQESTPEQIRQQITRSYSKALSLFGRSSFHGYCGPLTGYQIYLLGITTQPYLRSGKDFYDIFCEQTITSGGYGVQAYPASQWTLREALDDITENGTKDVYNILVGYQATPSASGSKYGHSTFIHAIIDGQVYFMDSYNMRINGTRYPEGSPVSCSIADYCAHYKKTTTKLDGVVYFREAEYVDACTLHPSSFYAAALTECELRSQPCTAEEDSTSQLLDTIQPGEQLNVTATVENTNGALWYRVEEDVIGYIPASNARVRQFLFDDVKVEDVKTPTFLRYGKSELLKGTISSEENTLAAVHTRMYSEYKQLISEASDAIDKKNYRLKDGKAAKELDMKSLEAGRYYYELSAEVDNYYVEDNQLRVSRETVQLWNSEFVVSTEKQKVRVVTFEAGDGTVELNSKTVLQGESIGQMPEARRSGYVFRGWFTAPEGGEQVTEGTVPSENMVLYAQWERKQVLYDALDGDAQYWYFFTDGLSSMGCVELNGDVYYFSSPDFVHHDQDFLFVQKIPV